MPVSSCLLKGCQLDEREATLAALTARVAELEGALRYARPYVVSYGWTQGNSEAWHAELIAPIDAALAQKAPPA
jgi:hypothetical protein